MKKEIITLMMGACMGILLMTGCANNEKKVTNSIVTRENNKSQEELNREDVGESKADIDVNELYDNANLNAKVSEFTEFGFLAEQSHTEGDTTWMAAEGEESHSDSVEVQYLENTEFQKAVISTATEEISNLEKCTDDEIKKQSNVLIYGTYDDKGVLKADKVILLIYQ